MNHDNGNAGELDNNHPPIFYTLVIPLQQRRSRALNPDGMQIDAARRVD